MANNAAAASGVSSGENGVEALAARAGFHKFEIADREEREEKMRKGRFRLGVFTLFSRLRENTTSHGLPHVHHARGQSVSHGRPV